MNSFGQNTVELFLIWSLEDCHFFSLTTIERVKKIITKVAGPESQLSLSRSQNSLGMTVCGHINIDFSLL